MNLSTVQLRRFSNGGGVAHRIPWKNKAWLSAWFDPSRRIVAIEAHRNYRGLRVGREAIALAQRAINILVPGRPQ